MIEVIIINIIIRTISASVFVVHHQYFINIVINIQFVNTIKYSVSIIITIIFIIAKRKKIILKNEDFYAISRKELYCANDFMKDLILNNINVFNFEYRYNEFKNFYRMSSIELNIY